MSLCTCIACAQLGAFLERASSVPRRALDAERRTGPLSDFEARLERHHRLADRSNRPSPLTRAGQDHDRSNA